MMGNRKEKGDNPRAEERTGKAGRAKSGKKKGERTMNGTVKSDRERAQPDAAEAKIGVKRRRRRRRRRISEV